MDLFTANANSITDEHVESYKKNGFLRVRGIITKEEAERFRKAADEHMATFKDRNPDAKAFRQYVNTWTDSETMKELTLHPNITSIASRLAAVKLRLWHDHLLVKQPKTSTPTQFHQDQPYWPHANGSNPLSCWVALNDVPVERGCMTFIPGSHGYDDLDRQNLNDAGSLFSLMPDLAWDERVTLPLHAGDCTFHHGRTAHMANANVTDENRYGVAIIYMDATTTYTGTNHALTDMIKESGISEGDTFGGKYFPEVG